MEEHEIDLPGPPATALSGGTWRAWSSRSWRRG